jgi:hypothetical protein
MTSSDGLRRFALVLGISTIAVPSFGADEASPHEQAIMAFEEGRALIKSGDCTRAIPKLQESLTHEASVGAHLSLAECFQPTDPLVAWHELKEAEFLTYTRGDERTKIAHDRAAALEPKLALIHVVVPPALLKGPGLEVKVDQVTMDRFYYQGGVIAVTPGHHTIEATAPGKRFVGTADATVGATADVSVALTDAPPETPVAAGGSATPSRQVFGPSPLRRGVGLVIGTVGVVGVVTGIVSGAFSLSFAGQAKTKCPTLVGCATGAAGPSGSADKANLTAVIADVGLFGGGAFLVAGVVLYVTAPKVVLGEASAAAPVRIVPVLGPGTASLVAMGRF